MLHTDIGVECGTQHMRSLRDLLGSESGHLGPSLSSGLLHHLKQVSAPFWACVSLVDCVPPGLMVSSCIHICLPSTVSTPQKTANEPCVV